MPNSAPPDDLAGRIQRLLDERQQHAEALARIDQSFFGIVAALENAASNGRAEFNVAPDAPVWMRPPKRRGRPPGSRNAPKEPAANGDARRKRRRTRRSYATTAEESILGFIKEHRNPTTREIKGHWAGEGRLGTADTVLSKLFRERRVRRKAVEDGGRGSRYMLP